MRPRRIYLDYASSTPIDRSMMRGFPKLSKAAQEANPSSLHKEGVAAKHALTDARKLIAKALHAHSDEIIYTSGATESDNLALLGSIHALIREGVRPEEMALFVSSIEHAAVLEVLQEAARLGVHTGTIPAEEGVVQPNTIIIPEGIRALIVSVMYVNNEIGTVQPIHAIAKRIRYLKKQYPDVSIRFHVDATQAPLLYPLTIASLGADLMTLGATKLYCPKGVGLLYKRRSITLAPIMIGGGQEFGLRPGTQAVSLIHTFSHAVDYALSHQDEEVTRLRELQTYFEYRITTEIPSAHITAQDIERSPHITHVAFQQFDSELLVLEMDAKGIAVSAKSACKNEEDGESSIVQTIYGPNVGAIRFSFGRTTTKKELNKAISVLKKVLKKYKR